MRKTKVFLADDHQVLIDALQSMLEPKCEVVGRAENGRALLEKILAAQPDVVVMDITMPLLNGLDACRELKQQSPHLKVIFLTFHEEAALVLEAFKVGASAYVAKRGAAAELTEAIDRVMRGGTYVSSSIAGETMISMMRNPRSPQETISLTGRQREIVQLLAEGRAMKEIANILNITVSTVADHKYSAMETLQIKTNAQLVKYAIAQGMIT